MRADMFAAAQVPFAVVVAVLFVALAIATPSRVAERDLIIGAVLVVVTTALARLSFWERAILAWKITIPILDLVAVAILWNVVYDVFPATIVLVVFPLMVLAYSVSWIAAAAGVLAAFAVTLYPFAAHNTWPTTSAGWVNVFLLTGLVGFVTVSVRVAADRLSTIQEELADVSTELRGSLDDAVDRENALTLISETVDAAIVVVDSAGHIVLRNRTARELEAISVDGRTDDHLASEHPVLPGEQLVYAMDRVTPVPLEDRFVAKALRGESTEGIVYWLGAPGNQAAIQATSRPLLRAGAKPSTLIVAHDVTQLVEAIRVRDEFIGTVSHELRTPLTNIIGYAELIEADELGISSEMDIIRKNAERLRVMIGDLLSVNGSQLPAITRRHDITAIVTEVLDRFAVRLHVAGIGLTWSPTAPIHVDVDPARITDVVDQLVSNAIRFTSKGGHITVIVTADDGNVYVAVEDTGVGIAHQDQGQVFERFFRTRSARTSATPGAGLGLSLAQAHAAAHRGVIRVSSELGAGSVFTLQLPAARE